MRIAGVFRDLVALEVSEKQLNKHSDRESEQYNRSRQVEEKARAIHASQHCDILKTAKTTLQYVRIARLATVAKTV